ncbi:hypothetical protein JAAARDRAFT_163407 [Jaapia argillacea MUCL 33604]|uniref:Magnesium-dependent phosphatase-1 n=1 Tax=Jaapia argillacea MUCL 33604 TaxID=933084 RepID=A0A067PA55_9AGAM|nr:hypothetical protein JAAARDRAFT_163407 [Jaapia argillacea MUCL 33604]
MTSRLPKLIAFDLDYTLWDLWVDTHVTPPLRREGDTPNKVLDKYGESISFYRDVPQILYRLRAAGVIIAAASRTAAPKVARQALDLLLLPHKPGERHHNLPQTGHLKAIEFFDQLEIYPMSKIAHFKELHKKTGLPYSEMLFFDDEHRNREVATLGVTFKLVPDGLNLRAFEEGLTEWRNAHPDLVADGHEQGQQDEESEAVNGSEHVGDDEDEHGDGIVFTNDAS